MKSKFQLPDWLYEILKWFCVVAAHAIVTYLSTLAKAWNWDIPIDAICITISATATLIGILIGLSTISYNKNKDAGDTP